MKSKFLLNRSRLIFSLAGVCLFLVTAVLAYAYFTYQQVVVASAPTDTGQAADSEAGIDPLRPYNILLLGHGDANHSGGEITDTMIVAHIAPKTETITLISIPRDIWVGLPLDPTTPYHRKINHAYAIGNNDRDYQKVSRYTGRAGGINLAKDMVFQVTDLLIDYTVAINFSAFQNSIDTLGGVTVDVPIGFTDNFYPLPGEEDNPCGWEDEDIEAMTATMSGFLLEQQFPCRYESISFRTGPQQMNGQTALKLVRSRHSDTHGNDFNRSTRQQAVIKGIQSQLVDFNTLPKLIPLINQLSSSVRTDFNISSIPTLWTLYSSWSDYEIRSVNLSTDNVLIESWSQDRQYILLPESGDQDWTSVHGFIQGELL